MNLFFDTETTGCPEKHHNWQTDFKQFPYILSMAWKFNGKQHYYLIYAEGRKVPPDATEKNGITTAEVNNPNVAKPFRKIAQLFLADAQRCGNIIGHNIYFDVSIFKANVMRHFKRDSTEVMMLETALHKDKRIDTMRGSMKLFGKWPKLIQLHEHLFGDGFPAHDALEDTLAVERCYAELVRRKVI